jgi:hypothetical protein
MQLQCAAYTAHPYLSLYLRWIQTSGGFKLFSSTPLNHHQQAVEAAVAGWGGFKLLFVNVVELPIILIFPLLPPRIGMRAASRGCRKERDYAAMRAMWVSARFAGANAGVVGDATVARRRAFPICRRQSELYWRQPYCLLLGRAI